MLGNSPNGPLTSDEFDSLKELGKPSLQKGAIPSEHMHKLVGMGLAADLLGGSRLTPAGRTRVAAGK